MYRNNVAMLWRCNVPALRRFTRSCCPTRYRSGLPSLRRRQNAEATFPLRRHVSQETEMIEFMMAGFVVSLLVLGVVAALVDPDGTLIPSIGF